MQLFLQILGVLCLVVMGLILLLPLAWWLLKRKLRGALESLADLRYTVTPARIHLTREESIAWKDPGTVQTVSSPLPAMGFQEAGLYSTEEMDFVRMQAWVNADESAYAVVYEHDKAGVWIDFVSRYENGDGVTYSTAPQGAELDHAPGKTKVYARGTDTAALYRRFLSERRPEGLVPLSADSFVSFFEKAYADEMDWRNSRGGATEEEIRRIAAASGEEYTDEVIAETRRHNLEQAIEGLDEAFRERFLAQTSMSAAEWEKTRERLVFIYDLLTPEHVEQRFVTVQDEEDEEDEEPSLPDELAGQPARQAFAALNQSAPPARRFQKLAELSEPVPADVYLAPETEE
jgi:hypothetical protein